MILQIFDNEILENENLIEYVGRHNGKNLVIELVKEVNYKIGADNKKYIWEKCFENDKEETLNYDMIQKNKKRKSNSIKNETDGDASSSFASVPKGVNIFGLRNNFQKPFTDKMIEIFSKKGMMKSDIKDKRLSFFDKYDRSERTFRIEKFVARRDCFKHNLNTYIPDDFNYLLKSGNKRIRVNWENFKKSLDGGQVFISIDNENLKEYYPSNSYNG